MRSHLIADQHVDRAVNTVFDQQGRGAETALGAEMVGEHGLAGLEGKAGRAVQIAAQAGLADHPVAPADTGADQEFAALGQSNTCDE